MKFRKAISTALAACILAGSCITPTVYAAETASEMRCGDVDLSGIVDVSDAVLIARYYVGDWEITLTDEGLRLADTNLDGEVNDADLIEVIQYIVGLRSVLGVAEIREESNYNAVNLMQGITASEAAGKEADDAFTGSQLNLAAKLFRETSSAPDAPENLLISPLSISLALAMTANGAGSNTLKEMEDLLGGGIGIDTLNQYYYDYTANLPSSKKASLHLANSIWFRDNDNMIQIPEEFLQTNANYYNAGAFRAPFDAGTLLDVNNWVKFHTHDMIPMVLNEIQPDDIMYLINALAFEAEWRNPYTEYDIQQGKFYLDQDTTVEVPMMYSEESCYLEDEWATGFIKYYSGSNYSFAAILPNESVTVSDYIGMMNGESLQKLLASRKNTEVFAAMPKFKFDYSTSLKKPLIALGMKEAFSGDADFSRLNSIREPNTYVGDVIHKTFIQVDERGTKAGAVTAVIMTNESAPMEPQKKVFLDRPFIFMILDERTQLPVFIGYVMNPAAKK